MPLPIAHSMISTSVFVAYKGGISLKRDASWIGLFIFAGLLPDLDIVLVPFAGIGFHRGMSHSFFFSIMSATVIFFLLRLISDVPKRLWLFLLIATLLHPICDYFTPDYLETRGGVQLFYPFSQIYYESPYHLFIGVELRYLNTIFSTHTLVALIYEAFLSGMVFLTILYLKNERFKVALRTVKENRRTK